MLPKQVQKLIGLSRDGEEWCNRRRALNKVLLKPQVISQYNSYFNDVVTDMLDNWDKKITENQSDSILVNGLEKELYNWSIECKCLCAK